MSISDSMPEDLQILEKLQQECLEKLKENISPEDKRKAFDKFTEIQRLKKSLIANWGQQSEAAVSEASEELTRQAAKFGLKWLAGTRNSRHLV